MAGGGEGKDEKKRAGEGAPLLEHTDRHYSTTYAPGHASSIADEDQVEAGKKGHVTKAEGGSMTMGGSKEGLDHHHESSASSSDHDMHNKHMLLWSFIGMVVFGLGNIVFNRLETRPMFNYPYFLNVFSNVFIVPACFAYIIPAVCMGWIPKEHRDLPKYKYAIMGFLDMSSAVLSMLAVTYMSSPALIIILQQATIPISMALSKCFLHAEFKYFQYLGALMVSAGLVMALIPTFMAGKSAAGETAQAFSPPSSLGSGFWEMMLLLSNVPMCLSSLYKEIALGTEDMDVVYLNGWVALFQLLWTLPAALPSALIQHLPLAAMPNNLYQGWVCYAKAQNSSPGDDCRLAPLLVNAYLVFNLLFNLNDIGIVKYGGANFMWMASTVLVPLTNVAFTLDFLPGHQRLGPWDILGLLVIVSGLTMYRFWPDLHEWMNVRVLKRVLLKDSRRLEHGLANINMMHRVFHRVHVPTPHSRMAQLRVLSWWVMNGNKTRLKQSK